MDTMSALQVAAVARIMTPAMLAHRLTAHGDMSPATLYGRGTVPACHSFG